MLSDFGSRKGSSCESDSQVTRPRPTPPSSDSHFFPFLNIHWCVVSVYGCGFSVWLCACMVWCSHCVCGMMWLLWCSDKE